MKNLNMLCNHYIDSDEPDIVGAGTKRVKVSTDAIINTSINTVVFYLSPCDILAAEAQIYHISISTNLVN